MDGGGANRKRALNLAGMHHQLRLADQRHGHPFRATLRTAALERRRAAEDSDVKLFVLSFTAFFVCFYTFIA